MSAARSVLFLITGKDNASPAFRSAAKSAETAAVGIDRSIAKMERASARLHVVGQKMTKAITLPVVAAVGVAVDQAVKYQKAMTLLETAGGESAQKMTVISKGLMDVAKQTGTNLNALGEGMYTVAKAGSQKWSATDQLIILKAAAQGAKAENVDLGTATNALTSVLMSYHLGAKDAVAVQNELVIGAGKAKTTMQEYAGSLATVVPVASAAGISFSQIGGAIATLTQHGTSAQEATQELANTIRNLQAPNHVAIVAMQQLGLNVTDVSKNLGKRGLTGTIDLVTNAIRAKMGPSGLVVVDVFKKSQSATADLNVELSKMPKSLSDMSRQFETGKLSYKDYYKAVKNLGGAQFEMGRQFIATMGQAKGFNDMLKAGNPAAVTFAGYLTKVMGGATGLNTALQLGGENMKYFKTATDEISKAAQNAGVDVLGWAKTQDTLAVKMDKAKANLQVLAVEVGTALIPAVTKLVGWITGAVKWFDGLSSGAKKFIGWTVLVIAALGPLIAITGRVGKALGAMWSVGVAVTRFIAGVAASELSMSGMQSKAYLTGAKIRDAFSTGRGAVGQFTSALTGAAIGTSLGMLTRNSTGAMKAVSTVGSTAAGALMGLAVGGPVGAAVGGLSGLISSLAANFLGIGDSAHKGSQIAIDALNEQKSVASDLLATLRAVNGAYDASTKDALIQHLGADKKGLPSGGILGGAAAAGVAPQTVVQAAQGNAAAIDLLYKKVLATNALTETQKNLLLSMFAATEHGAKAAERAYELQRMAATGYRAALTPLNQTARGLRVEFLKTGTALAQQAADFNYAKLNAGAMGAETLKTTAIISDHIRAINSSASAQIAQGKSVHSVATAYETQIETMRANLTQMGFNKDLIDQMILSYARVPKSVLTDLKKRGVVPDDIQKIIDKYLTVPAAVVTKVKLIGASELNAMVADIVANLSRIPTNMVVAINSQNRLAGQIAGRATGGGAPEGWFAVGEQGPELVHKQGATAHVFSNSQSRAIIAASGMRAPGFAAGTGGKAPTGTELSNVVQAFAALAAAAHTLSSTAADFQQATKDLKASAQAAGATKAYMDTLRSQSNELVGLARRRDAITAALGTAPSAPTAYDKLATAQQAYQSSQQSGGTISAFNITGAGVRTAPAQLYNDQPAPKAPPVSANTILQDLWKKVQQARRFSYLIKRMIQLGIPKSFVEQFMQAGPDASVQAEALIKASPKQLAAIRNDVKALDIAGNSAAGSVANKFYKPGVDAARGLVNGLLSQRNALNHAIKVLGDGMVSQLKRTLHIKSPSRVMHGIGVNTAEGFRLGIASKHDAVAAEGNRLAHKAMGGKHPHGHGAGQHISAGGTVINNHWEIHPSADMDETQLAAIAARRMAALVY